MTKTMEKLGMEGTCLSIIKDTYDMTNLEPTSC